MLKTFYRSAVSLQRILINRPFHLTTTICNDFDDGIKRNSYPNANDIRYIFRKVRNDSIMKNFSKGLFDPEILKVPDSILPDDVAQEIYEKLNEMDMTDYDKGIANLKKLRLFGALVPKQYGGLQLSLAQYSYILQHPNLIEWVLPMIVHQNLCIQTILHYGSEEQRKHYLPKLASGEWIGAFCLTENSSGSDMFSMQTEGLINALEDFYIVNGTKNWVINGQIANVFVVFALTQDSKYEGGRTHISSFIFERKCEGMSIKKQDVPDSLNHVKLADVTFQTATIPVENILFEEHGGYKIANFIQNNARCMVGAYAAGVIRYLVNDLRQRQINGQFHDNSIASHSFIECVNHLYAVESTMFFTARFSDQYEIPEMELESAAVKVFSIEALDNVFSHYNRIMRSLNEPIPLCIQRMQNRHKYFKCFLGSNYFVKLYIGGTMITLAEQHFLLEKDKFGKPIENLPWILRTLKSRAKSISWTAEAESTKYANILRYHAFKRELSRSFLQLQTARLKLVETLVNYKAGTLEYQFILEAISNISVMTYVTACCVARANTNYGDMEMFCTNKVLEKIRPIVEQSLYSLKRAAQTSVETIIPTVIQDIIIANGYPASDVLDIERNAGELKVKDDPFYHLYVPKI